MAYYIARDGRQYGPYSAETVRTYLAEGSLLRSDHARDEAAQSWQPLGQLFPQRVPQAPTPVSTSVGSRPNTIVPQIVELHLDIRDHLAPRAVELGT